MVDYGRVTVHKVLLSSRFEPSTVRFIFPTQIGHAKISILDSRTDGGVFRSRKRYAGVFA